MEDGLTAMEAKELLKLPHDELVSRALKEFVDRLTNLNLNSVEAVCEARGSSAVQILTVVSGNSDRAAVHEVERLMHASYPTISFSFAVVSSEELTCEQITAFRDEHLPKGRKTFYPRSQ